MGGLFGGLSATWAQVTDQIALFTGQSILIGAVAAFVAIDVAVYAASKMHSIWHRNESGHMLGGGGSNNGNNEPD